MKKYILLICINILIATTSCSSYYHVYKITFTNGDVEEVLTHLVGERYNYFRFKNPDGTTTQIPQDRVREIIILDDY